MDRTGIAAYGIIFGVRFEFLESSLKWQVFTCSKQSALTHNLQEDKRKQFAGALF